MPRPVLTLFWLAGLVLVVAVLAFDWIYQAILTRARRFPGCLVP